MFMTFHAWMAFAYFFVLHKNSTVNRKKKHMVTSQEAQVKKQQTCSFWVSCIFIFYTTVYIIQYIRMHFMFP